MKRYRVDTTPDCSKVAYLMRVGHHSNASPEITKRVCRHDRTLRVIAMDKLFQSRHLRIPSLELWSPNTCKISKTRFYVGSTWERVSFSTSQNGKDHDLIRSDMMWYCECWCASIPERREFSSVPSHTMLEACIRKQQEQSTCAKAGLFFMCFLVWWNNVFNNRDMSAGLCWTAARGFRLGDTQISMDLGEAPWL